MRRSPYYLTIFNHIVRELYIGKLKVGDSLPPLKEMCAQYGAGSNTVLSALKKLSDGGYITTARGKAPVVISNYGNRDQAVEQLRDQSQEVGESYDLLRILLPSMATYGARRFTPKDCDELQGIMDYMVEHVGSLHVFRRQKCMFIEKLLSKTENAKMLELHSAAEEAVMVPRMAVDIMRQAEAYLRPARLKYIETVRPIPRFIREGAFDKVHDAIYDAYTAAKKDVLSMAAGVVKAQEKEQPDHQDPAPEKEAPSRTDEYLYLQIVFDIVGRILAGDLQEGDRLPSEGAMCKRYGVSMITVRKAYKYLNRAFIARTDNGVGTTLTLFSDCVGSPCDLRLLSAFAAHLETAHLATVIIRDLALYAAGRMGRQAALELESKLRQCWCGRGKGYAYSSMVLLDELVKAVECPVLDSRYVELKQDSLWRLYLDRFACDDPQAAREAEYVRCLEAVEELKADRAEAFAIMVEELYRDLLQTARRQVSQLSGLQV